MLKKLFIAIIFSFSTALLSFGSIAGGHCSGSTMNDGQTGEISPAI